MSNLLERSAKMFAYAEAIEWCEKEIKAVKRTEERANENRGAYSKEQVLRKAIRVFQGRIKKLKHA
jgi:putative IMPACT (imprinted ancient) family translation regulator